MNTLAIVETLATDGPLGVGELSRRTGIAKSTAQRGLETLANAGWVEVDSDAGPGSLTTWTITNRVIEMMPRRSSATLADIAQPMMLALRDQCGDAVHLVTLDGLDAVLRARLPGPSPVQVVIPLGFRVPAYSAATGKAMLAALPTDLVNQHLPARLESLTDSTISTRTALRSELATIRARGWATNEGEWEPSVVAVASAVIANDLPVAGLSISSTPSRLTRTRIVEVSRYVSDGAAQIGVAWEHHIRIP